MTVRAKFRCVQKTQKIDGFEFVLEPVTGGSPENDSFYKWTPGGKLELLTVNDRTASLFHVGREYYLDFTLAPAPELAAVPASA